MNTYYRQFRTWKCIKQLKNQTVNICGYYIVTGEKKRLHKEINTYFVIYKLTAKQIIKFEGDI